VTAHWEFSHTRLPPSALQAFAHAPQCAVSLCRFASQPLLVAPSQSANWPVQVPRVHAPLWQIASAWEYEHTLPHAPQFEGSEPTSTSQPFVVLPSQSAKPKSHDPILHVLFMHVGCA